MREFHVYSEIVPFNKVPDLDDSYKGVILSGSRFSVADANAFIRVGQSHREAVLGICYGAQYIAQHYGESGAFSKKRIWKAKLQDVRPNDPLFHHIPEHSQVWMSHGDTIQEIPGSFELIAGTESIDVAAFRSKDGAFAAPVYCLQFHPEVTHSLDGAQLLRNFVLGLAGCKGDWTPASFAGQTIQELKTLIGTDHVLMGLSGGVDSTVAAMLLHKAIGSQLVCFFIDNGLLRKNEFSQVLDSYEGLGLQVIGVDAQKRF